MDNSQLQRARQSPVIHYKAILSSVFSILCKKAKSFEDPNIHFAYWQTEPFEVSLMNKQNISICKRVLPHL